MALDFWMVLVLKRFVAGYNACLQRMKLEPFIAYRTTDNDCDEQLDIVFDELISEEDDGM